MWTFIFVFLGFFIVKFIYEGISQDQQMKAQGGVKTKYAKLIQALLNADSRAKIIQESSTFVNIGVSGPGGAQSFLLQQTFGSLTVEIVIKNNPLLGNMTIERTYPEDMDQDEMMKDLMEAQQTEFQKKIARYQ